MENKSQAFHLRYNSIVENQKLKKIIVIHNDRDSSLVFDVTTKNMISCIRKVLLILRNKMDWLKACL